MTLCTYKFIPSSLVDLPTQSYDLRIRQQPQRAKMSVINERDRRPIEPPPILQVHWLHCSADDTKKNLQCPFYFMVANLMSADSNELLSTQDYLAGSTVSSLHRLRDVDDTDGGFFVFGDLFCKKEGEYRLQFSLFEIIEGDVQNRQVITSDPFRTYMPRHYPGPVEATILSRAFSEQGMKMRIRKEHRVGSKTARKRRLDVQALMDSQLNATSFKTMKISLADPHYIAPTKIAPAAHRPPSSMINDWQHHEQHHQLDSTALYHQQHQSIFTQTTPTSTLTDKDHMSTATHAYPSPPLLPANSCSPSTDEFPVTFLNEYHLQQQQFYPSSNTSLSSRYPSPVSSHGSHQYEMYDNNDHPATPPSVCDSYFPFLQHHVWGERLPALKAVMSGHTSRSTPLILPCPFENL